MIKKKLALILIGLTILTGLATIKTIFTLTNDNKPQMTKLSLESNGRVIKDYNDTSFKMYDYNKDLFYCYMPTEFSYNENIFETEEAMDIYFNAYYND